MNRIRWYGPSIVLLLATLLVMVAAPRVAQQIAWAGADAHISLVRDNLSKNPSLSELSESFRKVAEVVEPSVVHIQVSSRQRGGRSSGITEDDLLKKFFGPHGFRFDRRGGRAVPREEQDPDEDLERYNVPKVIGSGSGWVYNTQGHIITNNHVIDGADTITVRFHDGTEHTATVVGVDPKTDIAVLSIDNGDLHPATLASEPVEQGNIVFAFGSPFGFEFSMSQGIVSAKGRRLGIVKQGGYENFIQTDAAINRGNSGGPMTNIYGQVVGMNTAIATRSSGFQGLGFAIPVEMVQSVVTQLIDQGKVSRGYLGIYIADLPSKLAQTFGYDGQGVLVEDPIEGGPSQEAGIRRGDIITSVDGRKVTSSDDLRHHVASLAPGSKLSVEVYRDGQVKTFEVVIDEMPEKSASAVRKGAVDSPADSPAQDDQRQLRKLGFESLATFTKDLSSRYSVKFVPGVFVKAVRPDSAAEAATINSGHVITDVMGVKVESVEELVAELNKADLTVGVRMSVLDGEMERFVLLELPED
jgi:serine protease Do